MVCQMDLLSSVAKLVGSDIRVSDSKDILDAFLGTSKEGRKELVLEATGRTAYRSGDWAMIPPYKGAAVIKQVNIEIGNSKNYQLYNLKEDPSQKHNLADSNKEKLEEMKANFLAIKGVQKEKIRAIKLK